jgi:hypothetical protein
MTAIFPNRSTAGWSITSKASLNLSGLTATSRVVSNLPAGTWTFRAFASNSAGESASYPATNFNLFSTDPTTPTGLTLNFYTSNAATFAWNPVTNATHYRYWGRNLSNTTTYINTSPLTTNTFTLSNLPVGTYEFYIHAVNNRTQSSGAGTIFIAPYP